MRVFYWHSQTTVIVDCHLWSQFRVPCHCGKLVGLTNEWVFNWHFLILSQLDIFKEFSVILSQQILLNVLGIKQTEWKEFASLIRYFSMLSKARWAISYNAVVVFVLNTLPTKASLTLRNFYWVIRLMENIKKWVYMSDRRLPLKKKILCIILSTGCYKKSLRHLPRYLPVVYFEYLQHPVQHPSCFSHTHKNYRKCGLLLKYNTSCWLLKRKQFEGRLF